MSEILHFTTKGRDLALNQFNMNKLTCHKLQNLNFMNYKNKMLNATHQ